MKVSSEYIKLVWTGMQDAIHNNKNNKNNKNKNNNNTNNKNNNNKNKSKSNKNKNNNNDDNDKHKLELKCHHTWILLCGYITLRACALRHTVPGVSRNQWLFRYGNEESLHNKRFSLLLNGQPKGSDLVRSFSLSNPGKEVTGHIVLKTDIGVKKTVCHRKWSTNNGRTSISFHIHVNLLETTALETRTMLFNQHLDPYYPYWFPANISRIN